MREPGWDTFTPESGKQHVMRCRVCKSEMDVQRDINGPTSLSEAMGGGEHLHDLFTCSHSEEKWHQQVLQMRKFIIATPSATLAMLVEKEMNVVLKNKKATKDEFETI